MEEKEEKEESGGGEVEGVDEVERGAVRVLVVDDSIVDRKMVERLLLKSDTGQFEVVAVDSGKKAMEALGLDKEKPEDHAVDEVKIDIILTDYCMPEMNGYDLLEAVKVYDYLNLSSSLNFYILIGAMIITSFSLFSLLKSQGNKNVKWIPIVVMSSENDPQRISMCQASGAEEFIIKPLKTTDIQRLRSYVRSPESAVTTPKAGTKRKMPLDMIADGNGSERRPRLTRVTVA